MTMKVTGPNGVTVEFPDGTPPETIDRVMREAIGLGKPETPPVDTTADVAKGAGSGLLRGAASMPGLPGDLSELVGRGVLKLGDLVGLPRPPENAPQPRWRLPPPTSHALVSAMEENVTGPLYEPKSKGGKYARTLAEFMPGMLMGPGGVVRRAVEQTVLPALGSETAGQMTEGTPFEPYARLVGAIGGGSARRIISPAPPSPERLAAGTRLRGRGIEPTAGQESGNRRLQYFEDEMGGPRMAQRRQQQGENFTRAILENIGENATRATPDVIHRAGRRIGGEFDRLAAQTSVPLDAQLQNDLLSTVTDYQSVVGVESPALVQMMNRVAEIAGNNGGVLQGRAYQSVRSELSRYIGMARGETLVALREMQEAIDDAVQRHMPPDLLPQWQNARRQYRNLLVIERAAAGAGEDAALGLLTPARIRQAAVGQNRRAYVRGQDDFSELTHDAQALLTPLPQSGTAPRLGARGVSAAAAALAGGNLFGPEAGIGGFLAGAAAPNVLGALTMSGPGQAYLRNRLLPGGQGSPAAIAAMLSGPHEFAAPPAP